VVQGTYYVDPIDLKRPKEKIESSFWENVPRLGAFVAATEPVILAPSGSSGCGLSSSLNLRGSS